MSIAPVYAWCPKCKVHYPRSPLPLIGKSTCPFCRRTPWKVLDFGGRSR